MKDLRDEEARITMGEVRLDEGKSACFYAWTRPTGLFRLPAARAIRNLPLAKTPEEAIVASNQKCRLISFAAFRRPTGPPARRFRHVVSPRCDDGRSRGRGRPCRPCANRAWGEYRRQSDPADNPPIAKSNDCRKRQAGVGVRHPPARRHGWHHHRCGEAVPSPGGE